MSTGTLTSAFGGSDVFEPLLDEFKAAFLRVSMVDVMRERACERNVAMVDGGSRW